MFGTQDCLILLIQGGCKRWKEMFCSNIEAWMAAKAEEYQRSLSHSAKDIPPPVASIAMMFELAQGMDEIITFLRGVVSKHSWMLHIDDAVNIYNTSRTSLIITCLLVPAETVCLSDNALEDTRVSSPTNSSKYSLISNQMPRIPSSTSSECSFVPLQDKVIEMWILIRKSLLQSVIGKN